MKTAIMTFYRGATPGTFLQAWFLWKALAELGVEVALLDPPSHAMHVTRLMSILRSRRRGVRSMWSDVRTWFSYRLLHQRDLPKRKVANNRFPDEIELLVIGSDEVWNVRNPYYGFMFPMMWAAGAKCPVVTYAPSMGGLTGSGGLPAEAWRAMAEYHRVSVRDRNTLSAATEALGFSPAHVCDPTLLLTFKDLPCPCPVREPFLLVYTTGSLNAARKREIQEYAKARGLLTVCTGPGQPWVDVNLSHIHPLAALALFEKAACVYAGTFHGMVLGRKFRKPLAVEFPASKVTKSRCFLEAYCDPRCRIGAEDPVSHAWSEGVDSAFRQAELEEWIAASREYLAEAVQSVRGAVPQP